MTLVAVNWLRKASIEHLESLLVLGHGLGQKNEQPSCYMKSNLACSQQAGSEKGSRSKYR